MLRTLGVHTAIKWFVLTAVVVAVWRGFDGDLGAIVATVWEWVLRGADVVTMLWEKVAPQGR